MSEITSFEVRISIGDIITMFFLRILNTSGSIRRYSGNLHTENDRRCIEGVLETFLSIITTCPAVHTLTFIFKSDNSVNSVRGVNVFLLTHAHGHTLYQHPMQKKKTVRGGYSNNSSKCSEVCERLVKIAMYYSLCELSP